MLEVQEYYNKLKMLHLADEKKMPNEACWILKKVNKKL